MVKNKKYRSQSREYFDKSYTKYITKSKIMNKFGRIFKEINKKAKHRKISDY